MFNFPYFSQNFYLLDLKTAKKNKQSATVPKDIYCYRYCFLETKDRMHNEVGTCGEILPHLPLRSTISDHIPFPNGEKLFYTFLSSRGLFLLYFPTASLTSRMTRHKSGCSKWSSEQVEIQVRSSIFFGVQTV